MHNGDILTFILHYNNSILSKILTAKGTDSSYREECSGVVVEIVLGRPLFGTTLTVFIPTCILLVLSQMVRVFGKDHLEMIIEVNLTHLLVLATL